MSAKTNTRVIEGSSKKSKGGTDDRRKIGEAPKTKKKQRGLEESQRTWSKIKLEKE
jgi:hypothetical protein